MAATFSISVMEDGQSMFAGKTQDWDELLWCAAEAQKRRPRATIYLTDGFGRLYQYNLDGSTTDLSPPKRRDKRR